MAAHAQPISRKEKKQRILVVHKENRNKADAAQHQTQRIGKLSVCDGRNHGRPNHRTDSLHRKQDADPIACGLILHRLRVKNQMSHPVLDLLHYRSVKDICSNRSVGISPHKHKSRPAEELHQPYRPECFGRMGQQFEHIRLFPPSPSP